VFYYDTSVHKINYKYIGGMNMLFKTTIKYQESYLPTPRSRKFRYRDCDGTVYTEIKEVEKELAPVAFVCENHEYRLYEDNLYILTSKNSIVCNAENMTDIEKLAYLFEKTSKFYGFNQNDSRDEMIKKAKRCANNYLIIDGQVWEMSGEPRYQIATFGLSNNHGGTDLLIVTGYNCNLSNNAYFNAFEYDKAVEKALSVATKRGDTESIDRIKKSCVIKVLIPSAVKCNPKLHHCE
jgi:hypothetical protein